MRLKPSPIHTTDMQDSTYITRRSNIVISHIHTSRYKTNNKYKDHEADDSNNTDITIKVY